MVKKILTVIHVTFVLLALSGCGNYYMIKDPASGNIYYTTDYEKNRSGAISFTDKVTDSTVTLQNSELKELSKKEFEKSISNK